MRGLVIKSGYISHGGKNAENYMRYVATRDGVELLDTSGYLEYIAERPRSHGLFSAKPVTDLEKTTEEVSSHPAPVWTFICSLKREDAARLGFDSAESWRGLLLAHQAELAGAMRISPKDFSGGAPPSTTRSTTHTST